MGLAWAQGTYPWKSSHVIATIIVGAVVLIAFTLYGQYCITQNPHIAPNRYTEIYVPLAQPLMPMKLLKIRNFAAVVVVGCVGQMVFYALNTLWPPAISVFFTTDNIKIGLMSVCVTRKQSVHFEVVVSLTIRRARLELVWH